MDYNLINYIGVDYIDNYNFNYTFPYYIENCIEVDDNIETLLAFSLNKQCINYKCIETFEDSNFDGLDIYGNIIILNNKFDLNFEYGSIGDVSQLSIKNSYLYNSTFVSLKEFNNSNLDITLLTKDLFCSKLCSNKIFYCANLIIGINEL